jgi:hypothetical protein
VLITLTAKIFSGSHTKESARMRDKSHNAPSKTTQAPSASPEPASPAPLTFHLRDWVPLQDAVLQVISLVGGKRDLGLEISNRYLRSGQLESALVAPDGTMKLFEASDWERRTVHAPHNPAEGVRVEPYEAGHYFVRRAGLAKLTSPATPTTPTDRQLYAESGSESAAREPKPAPPSPQVEPEPPPEEPEQQRPPLLLLPDEPQFEEPRKWRPKEVQTWFSYIRKTYPQKPWENKSAYARRLYDHMKNNFREDIPWSDWKTLLRRLNDPTIDPST